MPPKNPTKQNITISLQRDILLKAKILAARRSTSISGLVASQIEVLVGDDEAYARDERRARELMDRGFDMGARPRMKRDELHER